MEPPRLLFILALDPTCPTAILKGLGGENGTVFFGVLDTHTEVSLVFR